MHDEVLLLGRVLFSLVLLDNAVRHLITTTAASTAYAEYKGVPNAGMVVRITGVLMTLGGLAVVLGIWADLAGLSIAVLMVLYGLKMHDFWAMTDPQAQAAERAQFFKNISIAGGGIMLSTMSVMPYTLTDGVF